MLLQWFQDREEYSTYTLKIKGLIYLITHKFKTYEHKKFHEKLKGTYQTEGNLWNKYN